MAYPSDRKYTKEHEWVRLEGKRARVGITEFAQKQLGDIVFVEMPKVGFELEAGDPFGTVESVKAVTEVYAPATGKVVAVNETVSHSPEEINMDAHDTWVIEIELSRAKELDALLTAAQYEAYIADEG